VSVIIPCYNYGQYLDFAVDSILAQTVQNLEIIIVDDGSTDPLTLDKLNNYNRPQTRVVHQKNGYPASARNNGFRASKGKYLLTLDADDMFEKTFLEKAIPVLDNHDDVGAVSSYVLQFGYSDSIWKPLGGGLESFILKINCHANALVRRRAWEEAGGFNEKMIEGYEDWNFWIDLTKRGWLIHIIPELLLYYRLKSDSRVNNTLKEHDHVYAKIKANHPEVFGTYGG